VYKLYGVFVHSGDVTTALRTTTSEEWFSFNHANVQKVSNGDAIDAKFSSSSNAYVLKAGANELLWSLPDDVVPTRARIHF
jgi:hypothetical protein